MGKKSSGNGGGAPRGTKERRDRLKEIIDKTITMEERVGLAAELARGVVMRSEDGSGVSVKDEKGVLRSVHVEKPDLKAVDWLESYATGKPKFAMEVESEDDAFACILVPAQIGVRKR